MSEIGRNIVQMMKQVQTLFEETARLLKTADEYMKKAGWTLRTNQCITVSAVPEYPSYWFPEFATRFYKSDRNKHLLSFVSVIFYSREGKSHMEEPLLSGGWHDYGTGSDSSVQELDWEQENFHPYMPGRKDDGTLVSIDPRQEWPQYKYKMEKTTTLAVPLVNVTTAEELRTRIIDPLLSAIQRQSG